MTPMVRRRGTKDSGNNRNGDSISKFIVQWNEQEPGIDASPLGILGRIQRLAIYLRDRANEWLAPMDLAWESFSIIAALRRSGKPFELRPTDMYREALLSSGAITNRIDLVERKGWVERRHDPTDRRGTIVRLTPAGKAVADKAIKIHFRELNNLIAELNRNEREDLSALLEKLLGSIEKDRIDEGSSATARPRIPRSRTKT